MGTRKEEFLMHSILSFAISILCIGLTLLIQANVIPYSKDWIKFSGIVFFAFLGGGYFAVGLVYWFGYRKMGKRR